MTQSRPIIQTVTGIIVFLSVGSRTHATRCGTASVCFVQDVHAKRLEGACAAREKSIPIG